MGKKQFINATYKNSKGSVKAGLQLLVFKEGTHFIVYSPHLDLSGYGKTEKEASKSFEVSLKIFFEYTVNKGTLLSELRRLGWKIKGGKRHPSISAPKMDELLRDNEHFLDILENKDYKKYNYEIQIPELV